MQKQNSDAIVIGAGLGGLLSAAQLLQRGKRVILLERLPHCGGRFTAKTFQGAQISTGAVHMLPFGSSGVLSRMLQRLRVPHTIFDADVFGSFHVRNTQIRSRGLLGMYRVLGPRQFFRFVRVGYLMFFKKLPAAERTLPFDVWLARHVNIQRNRELLAFFASLSRFALSLELHQITTAEVIRTTKHMFRFGAPGILQGGCGALTHELEQLVRTQGADLRLSYDVLQILSEDGRMSGVRVRNKLSGAEELLYAPLVVSDIGPRATTALLNNQQINQAQVLKQQHNAQVANQERTENAPLPPDQPEAIGLKVHFLSDISLIPHKGIMYCLDTQRIAGIVQPTNADPHLAPAGKHLLISHQVIQSENIAEEKALALADLQQIVGQDFAQHCQILTMSAYRGEWPVNRRTQGNDVAAFTDFSGLYLVGDAVKPTGYLMVEGVAQSVNQFLDLLDGQENSQSPALPTVPHKRQSHNVISPPSRLNALRWLWEAPGNSS
jgi:phytoene dehydrogenase-like protein